MLVRRRVSHYLQENKNPTSSGGKMRQSTQRRGDMREWTKTMKERIDFQVAARERRQKEHSSGISPKNGEIALLLATNRGCVVKYFPQKWNESNKQYR